MILALIREGDAMLESDVLECDVATDRVLVFGADTLVEAEIAQILNETGWCDGLLCDLLPSVQPAKTLRRRYVTT